MSPSERVILVEGFLDRAFVVGAMKRLGCESLGGSGKPAPVDPWNLPVRGQGVYAFHSKTRAFIRLVPLQGNDFVTRVKTLAEAAKTKAISHLLVIPDCDLAADADVGAFMKGKSDALAAVCGSHTRRSDTTFNTGSIGRLEVAAWAASDVLEGLPHKQTLERLACASIAAAHPERHLAVSAFLQSRASPPLYSGKESAMAMMAGWFAHRYSEGFFEAIWEEARIASELEHRLRKTQTYEALEALCG